MWLTMKKIYCWCYTRILANTCNEPNVLHRSSVNNAHERRKYGGELPLYGDELEIV